MITLTGAIDGQNTKDRMCSMQESIEVGDWSPQGADRQSITDDILVTAFANSTSSWHGDETASRSYDTLTVSALGRDRKAVLGSSAVTT